MSLTTREEQVLALLAQGRTNAAIASELGISVRTVGSHVAAILRKRQLENRTAAAAWYHHRALVAHG